MKKEKTRVAILDYSEGNVVVSVLNCPNKSEEIENELSKKYNLGDIHWMALGSGKDIHYTRS